MPKIVNLIAREIIDSRANPTIEVDLFLEDGSMGRAAVPSGASTGIHEVLELRDSDANRFLGKGVKQAMANVVGPILSNVVGKELSQSELDNLLIELDGTSNKSKLGANSILAVSLAFAWAVSNSNRIPLYKYVAELVGNTEYVLPTPMFNIMNGGRHANWATDIQEYMIIPKRDLAYSEKLRMACEIYLHLEKVLKAKGLSTNVGNEGGFAPTLESNKQALDVIVEAVDKAGYALGTDLQFGFDAAASEFYDSSTGMYQLKRDAKNLTSQEMIEWTKQLQSSYPVASFEDMLAEDDWDAWSQLTAEVGHKVQVVGDDLLVTNVDRIQKAIDSRACNSLLMKVNQIGTLTESLEAIKLAKSAGWEVVVSHRSGETEDISISHIVVGTGVGQIKTGAPSRGERTAKYNELLRIAEGL